MKLLSLGAGPPMRFFKIKCANTMMLPLALQDGNGNCYFAYSPEDFVNTSLSCLPRLVKLQLEMAEVRNSQSLGLVVSNLVVSNLVVCNFYTFTFLRSFALFCALLRTCICALLRTCICALLQTCVVLVCGLAFSLFCAHLRSLRVFASDRV